MLTSRVMKSEALSTRVQATRTGHGLFALLNFEEDTIVDKFQGQVVAYSKIPANQIKDVFEIDENRWIVPRNHTRHVNHSCDPNCYLSESLDLVTLMRIQKGE